MHYVLAKHKVEDYDKWKEIFDKNMENRRNNGSKGAHVLRSADDPNEIVILFQWDSLANAEEFFQSDDFKERVKRAGIPNKPDIYYLEGIGRTQA